MGKKKNEKTLERAYYSAEQSGSLGGVAALKQGLQKKKKNFKTSTVKKWLQSQDTYSLHKPVIKKFKRRATIVSGLNDQFQCDLIDIKKFKEHNNNSQYILTVIDVFSKYGWARALKSKEGTEVAKHLKAILTERKCRAMQSDKGKEFYNSNVEKLFKAKGITHFSTENDDIKAACVERFNRTIQNKLHRWFTKSRTFQWIDVLPKLITSYNRTIHRSTNEAPSNVTHKNEEDVWQRLYSHLSSPSQKAKFNKQDYVRISKYKHIFSKGYDANWSTEVFVVDKVLVTNPTTYQLRDSKGEQIHGSYYEKELQEVSPSKQFLIEKIVDERHFNGDTQYYVKFKGYPNKFNAWVNKKDIL